MFASKQGVALVTGGSGGIGSAVCQRLAEAGADVVFTYGRNADAAAETATLVERAGRSAEAVQLAAEDADGTEALVDRVVATHGAIHTLVHAAGPHVPQVFFSTIEPEQFRSAIERESVGFYNLIRPTLPHLRDSAGAIVVVTTVANARYVPRDSLSAGPKAVQESLVKAIAYEEGRFGIRANSVGPGVLADGMAATLVERGEVDPAALEATRKTIPLRRLGSAHDIAHLVCFLASDLAGYITGQHITVDGGYAV